MDDWDVVVNGRFEPQVEVDGVIQNKHKRLEAKVTAIIESQNLNTLGITTLFGKLKEHEHEMLRLKTSEKDVKKKEKKSIALKASSLVATSSIQDESDSFTQ
ncbi:hypothetical protein MTR_5g082860 [Medicago truncatula]|uniref:Uncharacterized protein n=1 Tax=Medicago truncatula TaxID=3880 RepID=G7K255_MEDTR|nr:hypothetical protein MTR_5g082860 [Medicago truncatula]